MLNKIQLNGDFTVSYWIKNKVSSYGIAMGMGVVYSTGRAYNGIPRGNWNVTYCDLIAAQFNSSPQDSRNMVQAYYISDNTWSHIAIVRSGNTTSQYINGIKRNAISTFYSGNFSGLYVYFWNTENISGAYMLIDDIVFIKDQALWTSNFTVPNNYLLGSDSIAFPKRFSRKYIYLVNGSSDYFDKAYLY